MAEGSIALKAEEYVFIIERERVDIKFKRELTLQIKHSRIRRNRRYSSFSVIARTLFVGKIFMKDGIATYKLDKSGIYNIVSEISNRIIEEKRRYRSTQSNNK